jgi:hypothetical protein
VPKSGTRYPRILLRAKDLTADQVDDGVRYTCLRTFTPGPAPYLITRAMTFRRKRLDVLGPAFIFCLYWGISGGLIYGRKNAAIVSFIKSP